MPLATPPPQPAAQMGPISEEEAVEPLRPVLPAQEQSAVNRVDLGVYALSDGTKAGRGTDPVEAFEMDRYPVTVARFRDFIDAGGYSDWEYWDDDGWHWRTIKDIECPRFWDEPGWERFVTEDRPVIGVSWYEARAYCRWAKRRLPTEVEWEAAARGTDGRTYTWGDLWEDGRIGNRGIGPRCTWPVGFCGGAVGPYGHHDLIGNVWQWTVSPYPAEPKHVVVRGGSWASRTEHCRTDHRNGYAKDGQWSHVGFRTCAKEPPPP